MKRLFLTIITIVLFSCGQDSTNNDKQRVKVSLVATDKKLSFKIPNNIINNSACVLPYFTPDSSYLYYLSGLTNKICVFNIGSQKLIRIINLEQRGPDGVGWVNGFEVVNPDSIYVTSNYLTRLFLVNSKGKLISYIDYSNYKHDGLINPPDSRSLENMRMAFKDDKIYLPYYPPGIVNNPPKDTRFVAVVDTQKKVVNTLNVGFPENYWDNEHYPKWFGFFLYKNRFYINYMFSNIIRTSSDGNIWDDYIIKSKYAKIDNYIPFEKPGLSACFPRLVVDTYRNVFYRFFEFEQGNLKGRTKTDLMRWPQRFSIIILDDKLEIIGETVFPKDKYDMNGYFITDEGLYLSLSNPFNPDYNEDLLEFQLFKIKKSK